MPERSNGSSWRRRAVVLALVVVASPLWAGGSAGPGIERLVVPDVVPAELVAAITAGRPAGYPVGGIDVSSHDHRRYPVHWPT